MRVSEGGGPHLRTPVITPSINQGRSIECTVRSILNQAGGFELEYRVFDGGGSDKPSPTLRRYDSHLYWKSEPD